MTLEQRIKSYMALSVQQGHYGKLDVKEQAETMQQFAELVNKFMILSEELTLDNRELRQEIKDLRQRLAEALGNEVQQPSTQSPLGTAGSET